MSLEENKNIARKLTEALNNQDLSLIDEALGANYYNHSYELKGPEAFKQFCEMFLSAFPDYHADDEHIVAEGDKVVVVGTGTGTHKNEFRGIPATGKQIQYKYANVHRFVDSKIVEEWDVMDTMSLYQVLGVIDYRGFPGET